MSEYPAYPIREPNWREAAKNLGIAKEVEGLQELLNVDFDTAARLEIAVMRVIVEEVPAPYERWFATEQFPCMNAKRREVLCQYVDTVRAQGRYS